MKYSKGYKYQLKENELIETSIFPDEAIRTDFIYLNSHGKMVVQNGYAWDGSSGIAFDTKSSQTASLVHDALYQLMRERLLSRQWKNIADILYRDLCVANGMWPTMANWRLWAVRKFGDSSTDPRNRKEIIEV